LKKSLFFRAAPCHEPYFEKQALKTDFRGQFLPPQANKMLKKYKNRKESYVINLF